MILGMSTSTYTIVHVIISLAGIVTGFAVIFGLLGGKRLDGWTAVFLASTVATSVTGFGFPFDKLEPPHILGIISLVVLAVAIASRYVFAMRGAWRGIYVITATIALYLNVFVLVVQLFEKVTALRALAPTQKEPPFAIAQFVVLAGFIALATMATKRFRPVTTALPAMPAVR